MDKHRGGKFIKVSDRLPSNLDKLAENHIKVIEDRTGMITDYLILHDKDCKGTLNRTVNSYLGKGYTLYGTPFSSGATLYQAVIKEKPIRTLTLVGAEACHSDSWIPVEERLPVSMNDSVVTYERKGKPIVTIARYNSTSNRYYPVVGWYRTPSDRLLDETEVVTHWQPFPEPPKRSNT